MSQFDIAIGAAIVAFAFMAGLTVAERNARPLPDLPPMAFAQDTTCRDTLAEIHDVLGQEARLAIPPDFDPGE